MSDDTTDIVHVERLGGLAGFGGPGSRLRSVGRLDLARLRPEQRQALETLLTRTGAPGAGHPDGFRYRLSRAPRATAAAHGAAASVELPESAVPDFVRDAVHDELDDA